MTADQAGGLTGWLKGMFPFFTDEQAIFWTDKFLALPFEPVKIAVERYANARSDFIDRAAMFALIDSELKRADPNGHRREIRRENYTLKAEVAAVDAFIAKQSDADLAELKSEVIASLESPWTADRLKDSDPRTSAMLKGMIYAKAKGLVRA